MWRLSPNPAKSLGETLSGKGHGLSSIKGVDKSFG